MASIHAFSLKERKVVHLLTSVTQLEQTTKIILLLKKWANGIHIIFFVNLP